MGLVNNQNLTVTIVPISNNITSVGVPKTYSNVIFNSVVNDNILVNLNSTIQQGEIIIYNIVVDNGTYLETYQILKIFGNPVVAFTEPANNTNQWTVSNNWTTTSSTFYSPSSSITESPNGNYQDNSQASITINNPINFLNKSFAEISFFAKWNLENNYDYVVIEVSTDNGNTWTAQCGKYTNAGINSQPLNQPLFDGIQNTWVEEKINLNSYLGQTILVRFRFKSDIDTNADGFYFDDFKISTITTPSLSNFMFDDFSTTIYPNPAKDKLSIESNIQFQKFNIVDELGRKILNGKIENNSINTSVLKSGIYVIELQNESYKIVKKIIIEK